MNKKYLKTLIIQECAKLMYFEGVSQYYEAKKIAAKRICKNSRQFFPSNGEISAAVYALSLQDKTFNQADTLFKMRIKAAQFMSILSSFSPRLIGSVSTGKIRKNSDIDLHVFCDEIELLTIFLDDNNIVFEQNEVLIQKNNKPSIYQHIYIHNEFDIELSVYPKNEQRTVSRSSTDGKPIVRLSLRKLEEVIEREHWKEMMMHNQLR